MPEALTAPFLVAALVLCVAGVAKLRSPGPALAALAGAGLPASPLAVRAVAGAELALGAGAAVHPGRALAVALANAYAGFAALALRRASRRWACGCFGATGAPATTLHAILSVALALVAAAAAAWPAHGLTWVLERSPSVWIVLVVGIGGAVFGTVVAYTELPRAWSSWSGR